MYWILRVQDEVNFQVGAIFAYLAAFELRRQASDLYLLQPGKRLIRPFDGPAHRILPPMRRRGDDG